MENKLDFSLPEKKNKSSFGSILVIILLLILIGLITANMFLKSSGNNLLSGNNSTNLSTEQAKELATKLAQRNLHTRAANVWIEYLSNTTLPDTERAKGLFQVATLYEQADMYAEAIEYFYRSEITSKVTELEPQINTHIKNCFEKLGKFSALRYELMDRTSFQKQENAGSEVVAEIGPEKITQADLDAIIEQTIDNQLSPLSSFMTNEQVNEQKKQMLERYKDPSAKTQFLQSWLAQEVLYRNALEDKLINEPQVQKQIEQVTREVLSSELMNRQIADKVNVTETDLQTYYQVNKDNYIESANEDDPNSVPRQKDFNEVRDQVTSELIGKKSQDVQQQYLKQLMDKYNIIIHTSVLTGKNQENDDK